MKQNEKIDKQFERAATILALLIGINLFTNTALGD
jgi:hypothetical protein